MPVFLLVLFLHQIVVVLRILAPPELLEHHHLIPSVLGRLGEKHLLLIGLRHVNDASPLLLVLGLESPQELIERLVSTRHVLDAGVKRFARFFTIVFNKASQLLDLLDALRSTSDCFLLLFLWICEE